MTIYQNNKFRKSETRKTAKCLIDQGVDRIKDTERKETGTYCLSSLIR